MAHIFDGLQGYEQVILVCGMALFVVALLGLIVAMVKSKSYAGLVVILMLSLAMMGFVRVRTIKAGGAEIDLDSAIAQVRADPASTSARAQLSEKVANIASRHWTDPMVLTKLAEAQLALGQVDAAKTNLSKALQSKDAPSGAVTLQTRIQAEDALPALTNQLRLNPNDAAAKAQLQQSVTEIAKTPSVNPATLTNVARAQSELGNKDEAIATVNKALQIDPNARPAVDLKNQLEMSRAIQH
jgi:tetratricopeptide (TPR) repeat protein